VQPVNVAVGDKAAKTSLKMVKLGASDLVVSEVCLGCMMFGSQNTEKESHEILDGAFERGVNFYDTAEIYSIPPKEETTGRSSEYLGRWLKQRNIKRDEVILATKVAGYGKAESFGYLAAARTVPPSPKTDIRLDAKSIEAAIDGELRRLGVDYIDLMQTHFPDRYVPIFGGVNYDPKKERESISFEEQVTAMANMIDKGKIRHWGISNETSYGTTMICSTADRLNCPRPITIQNSFSLVDRRFESELAEVCSERHFNIPLLPWSPAAGGVLSGKYLDHRIPDNSRMDMFGERYHRFLTGRMEQATAAYAKLARKYGLSPIQLAYLFCKSQFYIGSTIIGATSLEQLEEDLDGFSQDLSEEALKEINEIHSQNPNPQNTYS